ncbi:MAG: 3-deoxy-7-phosphoheptulonate synthase [Anaerorhabdus sp.]
MIVAINKNTPQKDREQLASQLELQGVAINFSSVENYDLMILLGDVSKIDEKTIQASEWVENVQRIGVPYKLASRLYHEEDSIVQVQNIKIGRNCPLVIMAGPCSVEGQEMMVDIAQEIKASGATILRGGAYKPRTSPYAFQGLKNVGLEMIETAGKKSQMPTVSELTKVDGLAEFLEKVDIIQIGARNMQNFELLKVVGKVKKPVLLKRGAGNTIEEWLMSAEYILAEGNPNVMLCERGIRTFESYTRNTLDLSAIPVLREKTHLPIIVDPSHGTGNWKWVESMSLAAIAAGADGIMVEVHPTPETAWSDGQQSLKPERFKELVKKVKAVAQAVGREVYEG